MTAAAPPAAAPEKKRAAVRAGMDRINLFITLETSVPRGWNIATAPLEQHSIIGIAFVNLTTGESQHLPIPAPYSSDGATYTGKVTEWTTGTDAQIKEATKGMLEVNGLVINLIAFGGFSRDFRILASHFIRYGIDVPDNRILLTDIGVIHQRIKCALPRHLRAPFGNSDPFIRAMTTEQAYPSHADCIRRSIFLRNAFIAMVGMSARLCYSVPFQPRPETAAVSFSGSAIRPDSLCIAIPRLPSTDDLPSIVALCEVLIADARPMLEGKAIPSDWDALAIGGMCGFGKGDTLQVRTLMSAEVMPATETDAPFLSEASTRALPPIEAIAITLDDPLSTARHGISPAGKAILAEQGITDVRGVAKFYKRVWDAPIATGDLNTELAKMGLGSLDIARFVTLGERTRRALGTV